MQEVAAPILNKFLETIQVFRESYETYKITKALRLEKSSKMIV
jgi:hypothetical protein